MRSALARHDGIVRRAIDAHGGYVFATGGDGFGGAFARAADGVASAFEAQRGLAEEVWPDEACLRVRMGLHTGEVEERDGDYFGSAVNRAARLTAVVNGGQIVCSAATAELLAGVELIDLGEHRLRDLSSPQRLFQVGGGVFPSLRSVDVVPTNLPVLLTDLIGRTDEIAEMAKVLGEHRLVTLTGTGGVGKTRLALAVAAQVAGGFPDGCWLVELAAVTTPLDVPQVVAAAVGAPWSDVRNLGSYLAQRRMLIVLDNCEHVLDAAADLAERVLGAGPEPVIVATSREPLGTRGEVVHRVRSLELPASGAALEEASESPAVRLFVNRAAAGGSRFVLDTDNLASVVEISRHLDGIPLAIELAAARVRAMPPSEIAARLGDRFNVLGGGSARVQERHRTLQAAVSWSHDLLSEDERVVFRRLGVFPGSFDLVAAEAVSAGKALDVLECVVRLVDRSLVQYEPDEGRYRLLETLRQYALDRLAESGETDAIQRRHARYFLDLAERIGPQLDDARSVAAQDLLSAEIDNLRSAATWCSDHAFWRELAAMAAQLFPYLVGSAPTDGMSWCERAIEANALDPQTVVDVLGQMAYLTILCLGDSEQARVVAVRSIDLAESQGLDHSALAWYAKSFGALMIERTPEGKRAGERALALAEATGKEWLVVSTLAIVTNWQAEYGEEEKSRRTAEELVTRAVRSGRPSSVNAALAGAVGRLLWEGSPDFAAALAFLKAHETTERVDDQSSIWLDIGWGAAFAGLHDRRAVPYLANAARCADRQDSPHAEDQALRLLAIVAAEHGHKAEAATLLATAIQSSGTIASLGRRAGSKSASMKLWPERSIAMFMRTPEPNLPVGTSWPSSPSWSQSRRPCRYKRRFGFHTGRRFISPS
jgi:predicted ATPase